MSLTYVQEKFCASAPCLAFYADSLHATCALHQVSPKLFWPLICIELVVPSRPPLPSVKFDFHIGSKCAFVWCCLGSLPQLISQCIY
ncbi:hypothetical protein GW17_00046509 [Ensete ventricosum]|nr:hypothetical protein GW17_00046509 [Ensete ventricosum]